MKLWGIRDVWLTFENECLITVIIIHFKGCNIETLKCSQHLLQNYWHNKTICWMLSMQIFIGVLALHLCFHKSNSNPDLGISYFVLLTSSLKFSSKINLIFIPLTYVCIYVCVYIYVSVYILYIMNKISLSRSLDIGTQPPHTHSYIS